MSDLWALQPLEHDDLADTRSLSPLGEVVGVAVLRRRFHGSEQLDQLVAQKLPCFGVITEINGHVGWLAKGLTSLSTESLEGFSRKTLELFRAVTREGLRRQRKEARRRPLRPGRQRRGMKDGSP